MAPKTPLASRLADQVRENLLVCDAAVSGRFSLCGLLLRMRNLYKWEHGLPPWQEQDAGPMLEWVSTREEAWDRAAGRELAELSVNGASFDPFADQEINLALAESGLFYGAGLAHGMAPVFFLAAQSRLEMVQGLKVYILERELCADLLFNPGLRRDDCVFLRKDPLAYLVWDKIVDPTPTLGTFVAAGLEGYGVEKKALLAAPSWPLLEPVLEGELKQVLWHELGEARCGALAADLLPKAAAAHPESELEFFVRGVKDLMADCGEGGRLHTIIKEQSLGALGFYPAWQGGFLRLLFPEIQAAARAFWAERDWGIIEEARDLGWQRAAEAAGRLNLIFASQPADQWPETARAQVLDELIPSRAAG